MVFKIILGIIALFVAIPAIMGLYDGLTGKNKFSKMLEPKKPVDPVKKYQREQIQKDIDFWLGQYSLLKDRSDLYDSQANQHDNWSIEDQIKFSKKRTALDQQMQRIDKKIDKLVKELVKLDLE